ncbi:immunoglobulin-like domain-containing protein [uncultured Polaribacter sp.]|uniref:immunoglobulin-like domain-containing protein n=1 Tax=uncultured Polaribacter sp. TaxID=174711 RepID=UPI00260E75B9|nr:immunoglobulin-like domain-containing protein [uncultured Polaribacter sp.]
MKKNLLKLLFVALLLGGSAIYSQTALPGTIEVETGDISNNQTGGTPPKNVLGSGNGGSNNIIDEFRKNSGVNGTIINHVSIAAGTYDFTFTYYKSSTSNTFQVHSTDMSGGSSTLLHSFTLVKNSDTGATTSSYGTQTESITIPSGVTYITITNNQPAAVDLDNVIVASAAAAPTITLLGSTPVIVTQGSTYTDASATALASDGTTDITGDIVTVNPVDVNTIGTYTVTYNVSDAGTPATEVTRTVNVVAAATTATQTGNWNDTATWGGNPVPTSSDDVFVPDGVVVTVTDAQAANILKVTDAANVVVTTGGALSITGDVFLGRFDFGLEVQSLTSAAAMGTLTVGGSVHTLNSDDATTSTSDKRLFVRKTLANSSGTDNWYLLSSMSSKQPRVNRMTDSDFRTNATPAYSIGVYNNGNADLLKYDYFSTTLTNTEEVALGAGMSVSVSGTGNMNSTGEFGYKAFYTHGQTVNVPIDTDGGTSDNFNLVGNPFLTNLHGNINQNATNVLTANTGVLEEATLWFWNAGTGAWVTKNQSDDAFTIPPVTGFFVKSDALGGDFTFTKSMETHTAAGSTSAKSVSRRFEINLSIESGELKRTSSIRYIDNTSTSFDNGYDSSMFGGYASELEVYTGIVEGDSAKKLAIQSLPNENLESMIVPVGVTVAANSEITFTAEALNVPDGYEVLLEDRSTNTFTRLDEADAEYKVTITDANTEGRFFLHTSTRSALSIDDAFLSSISIYKVNNVLRIAGLKDGKASVKLYNVLGKQVMSSNFIANGVKDLSLPRLAKGVYVVQLETAAGSLNKKIILNN